MIEILENGYIHLIYNYICNTILEVSLTTLGGDILLAIFFPND